MASTEGVGPVVSFPERVDRRLRLGPFPSARDAVKFLCYAAVGLLLAPSVGALAGAVVVGAGFLAAAWHPEGQGWDERAAAMLRWAWRARVEPMTRPPPLPGDGRRDFVAWGAGEDVAVVRTGGVPIAYLPPLELERRFAAFRDLLRATEGRLAFLVTVASIRAASFAPSERPPSADDRPARDGYAELVRLLCRRRFGRRVYLAVALREATPPTQARREVQVSLLMEHLRSLGVVPVRLRDRELTEAAHRFGW